MQISTQCKMGSSFFSKFFSIFFLFLFSAFVNNAQVYTNGPLSTGATSKSGVTAPAGTTWSEVQNNTGNTTESNTSAGYSFTTGTFTLADNFIVPAGQTWGLTKISVFAYITGAAASPSPFTDLRVQIWNGNPSVAGSAVVFGDLTTNRLSASVDALMYRIFNSSVPPPGTATGTTRKIWKLEANVSVSLPAGTYWVEWSANGGFAPSNTLSGARTTAGANALQKTVSTGVWVPTIDAGNPATAPDEPQDFPFQINYTTSGGPCAPTVTVNPLDASSCVGGNTSFSVSATSTTSPLSYKWQFSTDGGANYNDVPNAAPYSNVTSTTLNITGTTALMNGYKYRCVVSSPTCTAVNSTGATLTVAPLAAPTISPAPPVSMCLGTPIALNITTAGGFGTPVVANFSQTHTPPLTCISACNISSPISITGIPTGAVITQVRVTMNMTHTWISDMVVNLKAPNGNVLNLFNGDGGAGDNFVNTVVSSAGVTLFSAGTPPYTGTFAPKASSAVGPAGSVSNVTTFSGLYSVPNGSWTLVLQDLFTGDEPFLNNWSIEITYTPIVPVQGTWTPTAGLFTNAGGTTPYTGGLASTVYASPAASTSYSVSYVVGTCTSPATNIPVTVNTPVAVSGQPANKSVCTDKSTTISVTATGTSPTYQWQVSTTGAAGPWANIANNANYAGATTNTLTISNPPTGWNTYQYRAVVSGAAPCGSVNSNPAILTVFALPTVGLSASPYTSLFPGLKTVLTATSSPSGAAYLWTLNGGAIGAATTSSWQADVDGQGVYGVRVTDINGCVNNTNTVTIGDSVSGKVFIYPSPNNGQFQVRYHSVKGNQLARSITVFDSKGSKVYSALIPVNRPYGRMDVDLRNVGAGVYTVELSDANGRRINTGSVVVF